MSGEGGNPTVDAANEATGVQPLNAGPNEPQTPQVPPAKDDNIPASLTSLPSGYEAVAFPLSLDSKTDTHQNVSSLPHARDFEKLVQAIVRPSGPARAEVMETDSWQDKYSDAVKAVKDVVDEGNVQFYRVQTGKDKAEGYIIGLELQGERYLGVRILRLEG